MRRLLDPFERMNRSRHAFTKADAPLSAHIDFKDCFAATAIIDDIDVAEFDALYFVGPEAGVHHEEHEVVQVFVVRLILFVGGIFRAFPRRLVKQLVFLGENHAR